jgi:hypothetical protein
MIELAQNAESHELSEAFEKLGQEAARLQTVIDTVPSFLWTSLPGGSKGGKGTDARQLRQELTAELFDQESKEHAGARSLFDDWQGRFHTLGCRLLSTSSAR